MSGVRTKVGITEISSKLSAKTALMNPIKANNIEVKIFEYLKKYYQFQLSVVLNV